MTIDHARYEIGARLGSGAAADVYRARDRTLGHDVALKVLRPAFAEDPELVGRFEREAVTVSAIDHPNVVRVLDHGIREGQPYLAMELVEGGTLQAHIRARGRMAEEEARRIGAQIAAALEAAHARGIVHRDLKPANVLLNDAGAAMVSDFGIAHLEAATQLTRSGEVLGTPKYVAPEQVAGRVDARTDIYALGVVLYELVTGRPPFDGASAIEIVTKQMRTRPESPRSLVPGLSRELERAILKALEKDPRRRFSTAADMRRALERPLAAAVPAIAARVRGPMPRSRVVPGRALGAIAATVVAVFALTSGALARFAVLSPAQTTVAVTPVAVAPAEARIPTASGAPSLTATASPTPAATPAPTAGTAPPAAKPGDPRSTIASFYALVSAKRYDDAAALWSARMKAVYPPTTNIYGRFDATSSITLRTSTVSSQTELGSIVSVDVLELMKDGTARVWVGQWTLAWAGTSWLMDAPALRRA